MLWSEEICCLRPNVSLIAHDNGRVTSHTSSHVLQDILAFALEKIIEQGFHDILICVLHADQ